MSVVSEEEDSGSGEEAERDSAIAGGGLERLVDELEGDGADQDAGAEGHDQAERAPADREAKREERRRARARSRPRFPRGRTRASALPLGLRLRYDGRPLVAGVAAAVDPVHAGDEDGRHDAGDHDRSKWEVS